MLKPMMLKPVMQKPTLRPDRRRIAGER